MQLEKVKNSQIYSETRFSVQLNSVCWERRLINLQCVTFTNHCALLNSHSKSMPRFLPMPLNDMALIMKWAVKLS